MKNIILIGALVLLHIVPTQSQTVKKIVLEKTDNSQIKYQLSEVNRVFFTEEAVTLTASPAVLTTGGAATTLVATMTSSANVFECTSKPEWVSSVTFSGNTASINVSANTTPGLIREGIVVISTSTGASTESSANILVQQGGDNANMIYESLGGGSFPADWITMGTADKVTYNTGFVNLAAVDFVNENATRLVCKVAGSEVTFDSKVVTTSVDFKGNSNAGMFIYLRDGADENNLQFFANISGTSGYVYAFRGFSGSALALGDPIPGDPQNWAISHGLPAVEAIPTSGIDEYFRMEITNACNLPYFWQYQVNIWSLQTSNGITQKYKLHYTRKFEASTPSAPLPGYFGIWVKGGGESQFKNFMLSRQ
jgi:hypothetical protein